VGELDMGDQKVVLALANLKISVNGQVLGDAEIIENTGLVGLEGFMNIYPEEA
jgi:hypothetical protein